VGVDKKPLFKQYFQRLAEVAASGDAREESFYSSLESLFGQMAEATGRKHIHVTTLPKKTEAGNPDFRLWNGNHDKWTTKVDFIRYLDEHEFSGPEFSTENLPPMPTD